MATAPCRVCGHQVSEHAPACPQCGDPTAARYGHAPGKKTNPWMIIGWIILAALLLPLVTCMGIFGTAAVKSGQERAERSLQAPN
jgi:hypothetical protein